MIIGGKKDVFLIFLGDLLILVISIWLSLLIRFWGIPLADDVYINLIGYIPVIALWVLVFYIANLYSREIILFKRRLFTAFFQAQSFNLIIATLYFYLFQNYEISFGITPRAILFFDLVISSVLILLWRTLLTRTTFRFDTINVLMVGESEGVGKLISIFSKFPEYKFKVQSHSKEVVSSEELLERARQAGVQNIIVNGNEYRDIISRGAGVAQLIFSGYKFIDADRLYEELSNKIELNHVDDAWVIDAVSMSAHRVYMICKRLMDIIIALPLGLLSLILYPLVFLAVKLDDGGKIFISQERVGKNGKIVYLWKFRTMSSNDTNKPTLKNDSRVTRVGKFLRKSRIDELPQLWNVLQGRISLVGPRPELPHFVREYTDAIPYYQVRHAVPPGLSGWAQILYNEPAYDVASTKEKLAYDLYYVKYRSFFLDLKIALKTIKTLLSRVGI